MKKQLKALALLILCTGTLYANAIQSFSDFAFDNPANFGLVKDRELTFGGFFVAPLVQFSGTSTLAGAGTTVSDQVRYNPFGRVAKRIFRPVVIGFNVSSPWATDINYPIDSVVRYSSTQVKFLSTAITPTIAVNFSESFAVGAGFDLQNLYASIGFMVPTLGGDVPFSTTGGSWRYPWKIGAVYVYDKRAVFGLSYHNFVTHHIKGTAHLGALDTPASADLNLPATIAGDVKFAVTPKIGVFGIIRYSIWDDLNTVNINTNGPLGVIPYPLNYKNTWYFLGGAQYKFFDKLTLRGFMYWDQGPANDVDRGIGLPADDMFGIGLGAEYSFNTQMSAGIRYAHAFVDTRVNNTNAGGITVTGPVNINADILSIQFSYKA